MTKDLVAAFIILINIPNPNHLQLLYFKSTCLGLGTVDSFSLFLIRMVLTVADAQTIFGTFSIFSCCWVVASYVQFPEIRKLRYIELATYVAICDIFASLAVAIGYSETGSFACGFQSFFNSMFTLAGLFWSVVILYQVWLITVHGKVLQDLTKFHFICWGLPMLLTLLPLCDLKYGNSDDSQHWCYLVGGGIDETLGWMISTFFIWCWLAICLNVYFLVAIAIKLKQMAVVPDKVNTALLRLVGYPAIFTLAWLPMTVVELLQVGGHTHSLLNSDTMEIVITCLAVSPGLFQSMVFFYMNKNVRLKWYHMFYPRPSANEDAGLSIKNESNARLFNHSDRSDLSAPAVGSRSAEVVGSDDLTEESREIDYIGSSDSLDQLSDDRNHDRGETHEHDDRPTNFEVL